MPALFPLAVENFILADELVFDKESDSASNDSTDTEYELNKNYNPFYFTKYE